MYQIENYHLITKDRYASEHGGLAICVRNNWNHKLKTNVFDSTCWEELYIEVTDPVDSDNKFTFGNFYRPPHDHVNSLTLFIAYFSVSLSQYEQSRSTGYMCGDYNINLLKIFSNAHCNEFFDGIASFGFLPTITLPSRLSANSSLIDNIFINKQELLLSVHYYLTA